MSQIGDVFRNEGQKMPPSEIETSKIQHQIDEIIPLQEKKKTMCSKRRYCFCKCIADKNVSLSSASRLREFPKKLR